MEGCAYGLELGGDVRWTTGGRRMLAYPLQPRLDSTPLYLRGRLDSFRFNVNRIGNKLFRDSWGDSSW